MHSVGGCGGARGEWDVFGYRKGDNQEAVHSKDRCKTIEKDSERRQEMIAARCKKRKARLKVSGSENKKDSIKNSR